MVGADKYARVSRLIQTDPRAAVTTDIHMSAYFVFPVARNND